MDMIDLITVILYDVMYTCCGAYHVMLRCCYKLSRNSDIIYVSISILKWAIETYIRWMHNTHIVCGRGGGGG